MRKTPDCIHIGYSKAASTWLQHLLASQEDIFFVAKTRFFSPDDLCLFDRGSEFYSNFFAGARQEQVVVESDEHILLPAVHPVLKCSTTSLADVKKVCNRIKQTAPDVRLVLVLRNQTAILASRYSEYIRWGGKASWNEFISQLIDGKQYLQYADYRYAEVLKIIFQFFEKDKVLVLLQEEIAVSADQVIAEMATFLGCKVDLPANHRGKRKNPGLSRRGLQAMRWFNNFVVREKATWTQKTQTKIPYFLWMMIRLLIELVDRILLRHNRVRWVPQDIQQKIRSVYGPDSESLATFLEKDLSLYGYY